MPQAFFVTGTDTGVGKTYFTDWLLRSWRCLGVSPMGVKPITTGGREDAEILQKAMGSHVPLSEINPYLFSAAATPLIAAEAEGKVIDPAELLNCVSGQVKRYVELGHWVAVEGAGGWRVPIATGYEMRDLARDLGLPVIIVALNRLGMLNHTLLTLESVANYGCKCAGLVINEGPADSTQHEHSNLALESNARVLRNLLPGSLPIFQLNRSAQATVEVPFWLGGKQI